MSEEIEKRGRKITDEQRLEMMREATRMKLEGGMTQKEIAYQLGISPGTVAKYVKAQLDSMSEPDELELMRSEQVHRYMMIVQAYMPKIATHQDAAYLVMNAQKNIAKLVGLDAPKRVEVKTQEIAADHEELDSQIVDLFRLIEQSGEEALLSDSVEGEIIDDDL